jgi:glycosyltransferase involved in cell wall biosynthesis
MINSVLTQSFVDWELVITDDASTDDTLSIIQNYALNDDRIRYFVLDKNKGASFSRNNSIKYSKGKYLAFLDSDDSWANDKLQMQLQLIKDNPECPLFYSAYHLMNEKSEKAGTQNVPDKIFYEDLLETCSIGCLTAVVNTNVTGKIFMPDLRKRQDFAYWLLILRRHGYALGINRPLASYRIMRNSISSNKFKVINYQWRVYYEFEKLGLGKSIRYMFKWAINGFRKHYLQ